jgi:hypothetical protein
MIYVYITDGDIIKKSEQRLQIECDQIVESTYSMKDKLIIEDGNIIAYTQSKQYLIDRWEVWLREENERLKKVVIKKTKDHEALMTDYMRLNTHIALLRAKSKNDQITTDDVIWTEDWWPTRLNIKPNKSRLGS